MPHRVAADILQDMNNAAVRLSSRSARDSTVRKLFCRCYEELDSALNDDLLTAQQKQPYAQALAAWDDLYAQLFREHEELTLASGGEIEDCCQRQRVAGLRV